MGNYDKLISEMEADFENQDFKLAYEKAREAVKKNRLNRRALLYLAVLSFGEGEYYDSYRYYSALYWLQKRDSDKLLSEEEIRKNMNEAADMEKGRIAGLPLEDQKEALQRLSAVNSTANSMEKNMFATMEVIPDYFGKHFFFFF